jgi:four helix bundle protein
VGLPYDVDRRKAHLNHLDIARGSQAEVDVQLEITRRLQYLAEADYLRIAKRVDEIGRMLNGLIDSLQPTEADWR